MRYIFHNFMKRYVNETGHLAENDCLIIVK